MRIQISKQAKKVFTVALAVLSLSSISSTINLVGFAEARSVELSSLIYTMSFDACSAHFPDEEPVLRRSIDQTEICNPGYAVLYENRYRIPKIAFALITPAQLEEARTLTREGIEFTPDPRLPPSIRSLPSDYTGSKMDRGHMLGNGFFPKATQLSSFLMSNISPQDPNLNREVFRRVESDTRKYIRRTRHNVFIAVGQTHPKECQRTIGASKVCVISELWFAAYDPIAKRGWAHIMTNSPDVKNTAPITLGDLEKHLGYSFWNLDQEGEKQ